MKLHWVQIILLFLLVGVLAIHTLTSINQDIGRHLTIGRIIFETRQVPDTNLFSYTAPDFPFINHHWLGEVFLYLGSLIFGLKGLILLKAALIAAAFSLALAAFWRRETRLVSAVSGVLAAFILIERTDVRPEMLSFLFLGWYLFVLFREQDKFSISNPSARRADFKLSKYALWTLPFIQLLWVNSHIYFFLGPLIYVLFLTQQYVRGERFSWRDKRLLVGLAIILAMFINPFGWQGALYPLFIFGNYGYTIVENQTPFFLKAFGYPQLTSVALYLGIATGTISFILNCRRIRENIFGLGLFVITTTLALAMVRNYPLFAFVMIPLIVKNVSETGIRIRAPALHAAASILMAGLLYSVMSNQLYEQAGLARRFGLQVPDGAQEGVDFIRANRIRGPMFNNFDIGSFLIWKLPEEKVFIDGRPEAYPADFIQQVYIPMQEDQASWRKYSEQYRINFVFWNRYDITPWSQTFVRRMVQDRNWPLVYRDDSTLIFLKRTPENEPLIPKPSTL